MNINPYFTFMTFIAICCFDFEMSQAQSIVHEFGARSKGMGHANTAVADDWAIFNNAAGISGVERGTVMFGYDRFFDIEGFDRVGAAVVQPLKFGTIGLLAFRFGDELLSEQVISSAFSNKVGFVRLGAKINYYQIRIEDTGTSSSFYLDFGGIVELIPDLSFAAYISNLTVSKLNDAEQTKIPVLMKIGLSYHPTDDIYLNIDVHKDIDFDALLKLGLEYRIIDKIYLRTGINTHPFKAFYGGGLELNRFKINYAVSSHQFLGISHQASVAFEYQKQ